MTRIFLFAAILFACTKTFAQPVSGSSTVYSESQMRQARENAAMNRHYESIKPRGNSSGTATAGSNPSPYFSYSAQLKKDAESRNAFEAKKKALGKLIKSGLINRHSGQHARFIKAATDAGFSKEEAETYFGKSEYELEQIFLRPHHLIDEFFPGFDAKSLPPVPVRKPKVNSLGNLRTEDIAPGETDIVEVYRTLMHKINYSKSWEEKEQLYHRAIEISTTVAKRANMNYISNSDDLWYSLGYIKYLNGDYTGSVYYFQKCHEVRYVLKNDRQTMSSAVTERELFTFLYAASLLNNNILEAMAYLQLAVKHGYNGEFFLAHLHMLRGDYEAAVNHVSKHLSTAANPVYAERYRYYLLGLMLLQKKDAAALQYHNAMPGVDQLTTTDELRTNVAMTLYDFVVEDEQAAEYKGFQPSRFFRLDLAKQIKPSLRLVVEKSFKTNESFKRQQQKEDDLEVLAGKRGYDETALLPIYSSAGGTRYFKPNGHTNVVLNGPPHPARFADVSEQQLQQGYKKFESLAPFLAVLREGLLNGYENMFDRTTRFEELYYDLDSAFGLKYYLNDFSAFEVSKSISGLSYSTKPVLSGYHNEADKDNAIAYAKKLGKELRKTLSMHVTPISGHIFFESYVEKKKEENRTFYYCYRIKVKAMENADKTWYYRVVLEISSSI